MNATSRGGKATKSRLIAIPSAPAKLPALLAADNLIDVALMTATKGHKPWFHSLFQQPPSSEVRAKLSVSA